MKKNISLEEAQSLLLDLVAPGQATLVPLVEALGRVLAQDITAPISMPPFAKSALDGYALRAADTVDASPTHPAKLTVIEEIRAGLVAEKPVAPGTAIKLMTGAPIPEGADVIINYEAVNRQGDTVFIPLVLKSGDNIIPVGEDVKAGDPIARRGTRITPPLIAVFAGLGISQVPVFEKTRVALISTGDELMDPSQELQAGKIYNSTLYGLQARCCDLGAQPIMLGIAPDEIEATAERMAEGLARADIVITTGGVSVGDYDVVKDAMGRAGAELVFWKVAMKPGSPIAVAARGHKLLIGLSGNPAAAMVTFDLIVVPVIKKLMGMGSPLPPRVQGVFLDNFRKASPQRRLLRARLVSKDGADYVLLSGEQGNGILMSMIDCNLLVDIPAGSGPVTAGRRVSGFYVGSADQMYQDGSR